MLASLAFRLQALQKLPTLACIFLFTAIIIELSMLLSGLKPGLMEYANMLTINTSKIGFVGAKHARSLDDVLSDANLTAVVMETSTTSQVEPKLSERDVTNKARAAAQAAKNKSQPPSNNNNKPASTTLTGDAAKKLGVQDWYSYHLSTSCSGTLSKDGKKKTTKSCTKPAAFFGFDPAGQIQSTLKGHKIKELGWGDKMSEVVKRSKLAFVGVMFLYIIGMVGMFGNLGLSALAALGHGGFTIMKFRIWLCMGSSGTLFLATGVQGFEIGKMADVINAGGSLANVTASVGRVFGTLSWTVTALSVLVYLMTMWERRRMFRMLGC